PTRVLVIGRQNLPATPPLVEDDHFATRLLTDPDKSHLLQLQFDEKTADPDAGRRAVENGDYEAVVFVPDDFARRLEAFREALKQPNPDREPEIPSPEIFYNRAKEKSQLAYIRVRQVLDNWEDEIARLNLASTKVPPAAVNPFEFTEHDIADDQERQAVVW